MLLPFIPLSLLLLPLVVLRFRIPFPVPLLCDIGDDEVSWLPLANGVDNDISDNVDDGSGASVVGAANDDTDDVGDDGTLTSTITGAAVDADNDDGVVVDNEANGAVIVVVWGIVATTSGL